jgi:hypothetical protein
MGILAEVQAYSVRLVWFTVHPQLSNRGSEYLQTVCEFPNYLASFIPRYLARSVRTIRLVNGLAWPEKLTVQARAVLTVAASRGLVCQARSADTFSKFARTPPRFSWLVPRTAKEEANDGAYKASGLILVPHQNCRCRHFPELLPASRLENSFDDFARMHLIERFPPFCQGRHAI